MFRMIGRLRVGGIGGNIFVKAAAQLPTIKLIVPKIALEAPKIAPLTARKIPLIVYGISLSAAVAAPLRTLCMDSILDEDVDLSMLEGGSSAAKSDAESAAESDADGAHEESAASSAGDESTGEEIWSPVSSHSYRAPLARSAKQKIH